MPTKDLHLRAIMQRLPHLSRHRGHLTKLSSCAALQSRSGVGVKNLLFRRLNLYTTYPRNRNRVNRNQFEMWPSFPVENRKSLAWALPTKQARFLEAAIVHKDSLHRQICLEIVTRRHRKSRSLRASACKNGDLFFTGQIGALPSLHGLASVSLFDRNSLA